MRKFSKIYLEISNICNLKCSFCPGTSRKPHIMTEAEFRTILHKLKGWTNFLYFHIMGEPLCHPNLESFLQIAKDNDFKVILTTNGTLLSQVGQTLLSSSALHKINISLHAFEANNTKISFSDYLNGCLQFAKAVDERFITVFRLWNQGGEDTKNQEILSYLKSYFPDPWEKERQGIRIANRVYLEYGDKFDWPDLNAKDYGTNVFCHGLRDQIGILCDGTVVPCCLDHEGDIPLGNIFDIDLETIINSKRAKDIYQGFSNRNVPEELCRRCGYAQRFH